MERKTVKLYLNKASIHTKSLAMVDKTSVFGYTETSCSKGFSLATEVLYTNKHALRAEGDSAMRKLIIATMTIAWALWLGGCGMPLVQSYNATVPTPAGNGSVETTSVGGLYQSTNIVNPPGIERACLALMREWNDYLVRSQAQATPTMWSAWIDAQRQAALIDAPERCVDYATFGDRLRRNNGAGVGMGGGIAPFSGNRVFKAGGR